MKAMMTGFVALVLVSVGAHYILVGAGFSSQEQATGVNVRVE